MAKTAHLIASTAAEPLDALAAPAALHSLIDHHRRNLIALAASLLEAGLDRPDVERAASRAARSFQEELVNAIAALKEGDDAR